MIFLLQLPVLQGSSSRQLSSSANAADFPTLIATQVSVKIVGIMFDSCQVFFPLPKFDGIQNEFQGMSFDIRLYLVSFVVSCIVLPY